MDLNRIARISAILLLAALAVALFGGPVWPLGVLSLLVGALDVIICARRGGDRVMGLAGFLLLMVGTVVLTCRVR